MKLDIKKAILFSGIISSQALALDLDFDHLKTTNSQNYRPYDWYSASLGSHTGIDQSEGTPTSISFGKVVALTEDGANSPHDTCGSGDCRLGNSIISQYLHKNGEYVYALYGHLADFDVAKDNFIVPEQKVGTMGNTDTELVHLHFEIKDDLMLGNSSVQGWGYIPYGGGTDINPDDNNYHDPSDFMSDNTNQVAVPFLSMSTSRPSLNNYDVFGRANRTIYGSVNMEGSFYNSSTVVRDFFERGQIESMGGLSESKRFLGGRNVNASVNGINGSNSYSEGDYLFAAFVNKDGQNRFGYPVKFSFVQDGDVIVDNDQQNADGNTGNDSQSEPAYNGNKNSSIPGYFLTADLHPGRSGKFAQWKPYQGDEYVVYAHIPEYGATATAVRYVIKEDGVTSQMSEPVNQRDNQGKWVQIKTADKESFNLNDQGYVGIFLSTTAPASGEVNNYEITTNQKVAFDAVKFVKLSNVCEKEIGFYQTVPGDWETVCQSANRSGRYAKYYTFTLSSTRQVTIDVKSSVDTYMYLLNGSGKNGSVIESDDDDGDTGYNSQITRTLSPGTYTIEATTYSRGELGNFTVSIQ